MDTQLVAHAEQLRQTAERLARVGLVFDRACLSPEQRRVIFALQRLDTDRRAAGGQESARSASPIPTRDKADMRGVSCATRRGPWRQPAILPANRRWLPRPRTLHYIPSGKTTFTPIPDESSSEYSVYEVSPARCRGAPGWRPRRGARPNHLPFACAQEHMNHVSATPVALLSGP